MANLFAGFMGAHSNSLPATRAYGSVLTFRGRADMVDAASEAYFLENKNVDLEKEVDTILVEARGFAARRNEIAHGIVKNVQVGSKPPLAAKLQVPVMKSIGFAVVPSNYATNKVDLTGGHTLLTPVVPRPKYTYSSKEIYELSEKFDALSARVRDLAQRVFFHSMAAERGA